MSCFGRAWPPACLVPSVRPYFQAWHVRKPRRRHLTKGRASRLRRQQGHAGHRVLLSAAVPGEAPCACRPVRGFVHKAAFGCFVGSVSCIHLVLCFLGNFEVNSYSVSRIALTSLSDCVWSAFAGTHRCSGPLSPPSPQSLFLRCPRCTDVSTVFLRPWHAVTVWARPFFCWVSSHSPLLSLTPFTSASWPPPAPLRCVSCTFSSPLAVRYCVYMWWWLCWSFFFVYLVLCIWEIPVCLNELCFIYSDSYVVCCHFMGHLFIDCGQLCCHQWDFRKRSFFNVFFHIIHLFLAVLCRSLLLRRLFLRGCPLVSRCSGFSCGGAHALGARASVVAAPGLRSCGPRA